MERGVRNSCAADANATVQRRYSASTRSNTETRSRCSQVESGALAMAAAASGLEIRPEGGTEEPKGHDSLSFAIRFFIYEEGRLLLYEMAMPSHRLGMSVQGRKEQHTHVISSTIRVTDGGELEICSQRRTSRTLCHCASTWRAQSRFRVCTLTLP